ncbi:MAG: SIMPL domain-containing protein [Myxococcota bacterium]|nr:SIMPL domain-containing protein [Myxococcota bacterium]
MRPRAATVHITLTGSKLFSDRSALTKSEELRRLVETLHERGLPNDAIGLEGATLDVSTGLFSRSSSVTYRVSVRVTDLEKLPTVLETVAEAKQATLTHIQWDYAGGASDELLAQCATRAVAKAKHLAATLGVTLGALYEVHEEELGEHAQPYVSSYGYPVAARSRGGGAMAGMSNELAGLELAPAKQVGVRVRLAYRVG